VHEIPLTEKFATALPPEVASMAVGPSLSKTPFWMSFRDSYKDPHLGLRWLLKREKGRLDLLIPLLAAARSVVEVTLAQSE